MPVTARVEHVGSLLRPPFLHRARTARAAGEIAPAAFKAAEDRAVREVVALQEEIGLPVVNDGELRRESFQAELTAACDGFAGVAPDAWLWGDWHSAEAGDASAPRPAGLAVVAPLRKRRSLAAEEFTFVRACTGRPAKVTLPSPSLFASLWSPELSAGAYRDLDAFLADVVELLRDEVRELVRLGCGYIQLDAPHYPLLLDPGWRAFYEERGWPLQRWLSYGIDLDNAVIEAGPPRSAFTCAAGTSSAGGWWPAATTRSRARFSAGYTPTGCCSNTTTSGPAASARSAWCPTTRLSCSASSPRRRPGWSGPGTSPPGCGRPAPWSAPSGWPSARSAASPRRRAATRSRRRPSATSSPCSSG